MPSASARSTAPAAPAKTAAPSKGGGHEPVRAKAAAPSPGGATAKAEKQNAGEAPPEVRYTGFAWTSQDATVATRGKNIIAEILKDQVGGKSAILGGGAQWLEDGVYLPRTSPAVYRSGYTWFLHRVGELVWA